MCPQLSSVEIFCESIACQRDNVTPKSHSFPSQVSTSTYTRQVHEVPSGKMVTEQSVFERITWATWTR